MTIASAPVVVWFFGPIQILAGVQEDFQDAFDERRGSDPSASTPCRLPPNSDTSLSTSGLRNGIIVHVPASPKRGTQPCKSGKDFTSDQRPGTARVIKSRYSTASPHDRCTFDCGTCSEARTRHRGRTKVPITARLAQKQNLPPPPLIRGPSARRGSVPGRRDDRLPKLLDLDRRDCPLFGVRAQPRL